MIRKPGKRVRSAATIARVGPITSRSNSAGGSTPAQLSNSITHSAPASTWAAR